MNKDREISERLLTLADLLMTMERGGNMIIYCTAYKTSVVRETVCRVNKKFNKREFSVSDKGMTDRCVVTRLA